MKSDDNEVEWSLIIQSANQITMLSHAEEFLSCLEIPITLSGILLRKSNPSQELNHIDASPQARLKICKFSIYCDFHILWQISLPGRGKNLIRRFSLLFASGQPTAHLPPHLVFLHRKRLVECLSRLCNLLSLAYKNKLGPDTLFRC